MKKWVMRYENYDCQFEDTLRASNAGEARAEVLDRMRGWGDNNLASIEYVEVLEISDEFRVQTSTVRAEREAAREEQAKKDLEANERAELNRLLQKYGAARDS